MSLFGRTIEFNLADIAQPDNLDERLVNQVLQKSDERKGVLNFLRSRLSDGKTPFEHMQEKARSMDVVPISPEEVTTFIVSELKIKPNGLPSAYETVVARQVISMDPTFQKAQEDLLKGKIDPKGMPKGYPGLHKRAEGLLLAKIKDNLGQKEIELISQRKILISQLREIKKDLITGVNKFGLSGEKLLSYLQILFEISLLETAGPIQHFQLREQIAEALLLDTPLNLVHVKCLRYTYPKSGGVEVLTDTNDKEVDGINGKYTPKSETELFPRLLNIRHIFERAKLKVNFTVCIADEDLDLLFPAGGPYVTLEQLRKAKKDIKQYISFIKETYGKDFNFKTIYELTTQAGDRYKNFRLEILRDVKRRGSKFIDRKFLEEDRVDFQYNFCRQLIDPEYTREEAFRSISEQMTSMVALQELLAEIGEKIILIEEPRGGENKLIANGSTPIIFTQLRGQAKYGVEYKI